jgi:hypothetical protein
MTDGDFVLVDAVYTSADGLRRAETNPSAVAGHTRLYRCVPRELWEKFIAARDEVERLRREVIASPLPTFRIMPEQRPAGAVGAGQ